MKHAITLLIALCATMSASAQLQMKQTQATETAHKGTYSSVVKTGTSYDLIINDTQHSGTMTIHLGDSLQQAVLTYGQIGEWFENAENKTSIVVQGTDGDLTLYRYNSAVWVVSEGDAEYARKYINDMFKQGLAGAPAKKRDITESPKIGYLKPGDFASEKTAKIFSE